MSAIEARDAPPAPPIADLACATFADDLSSIPADDEGNIGPFCCGARVAQVELRRGRRRLKLDLSGIYFTDVLTVDGDVPSASSLTSRSQLVLTWSEATFVGRHALLGDVVIELQPRQQSLGSVAAASREQDGFFPALNRNEFFFSIKVPRLGREYRNEEALVNKSLIEWIPPRGSVYALEQPVRFTNTSNAGDWWDITKCWVLIPDQKWVLIDVTDIAEGGHRFHITATLRNVSPKNRVKAYWFTRPDAPSDFYSYEPTRGVLWLGRKPKEIRFDLVVKDPSLSRPIVEIGAAVIANPIVNDPNNSGGVGTWAVDVRKRQQHLGKR
jgi:hypothetical protein